MDFSALILMLIQIILERIENGYKTHMKVVLVRKMLNCNHK